MSDQETIVAAVTAAIAFAMICACWFVANRRAKRAGKAEPPRRDPVPVRPTPVIGLVPRPGPWPAPPPVRRTAVSSVAPEPSRREDDSSSALIALTLPNSASPSAPLAFVPSDPEPFSSGGGGDFGGGGASSSWDSGSSCSSDSSSSSSTDSGSCSSSD